MQNKTAPNFLLIALVSLLPSVIFPKSAIAQSSLGITAIPPRLENIILKPGEVTVQEIKVRNESRGERIMNTSVKDFIVNNTTGTPVQVDATDIKNKRWAASDWITVQSPNNKLKAGETKTLQITIAVPEDALPGGHYAMILHSPTNDSVINESGAAITTNVGTLVYITVPGDIKQDAKIKEFIAPTFAEYGPIDFKTTIQNLSDIHITPVGAITVNNMFGFKTSTLRLDETNIFPYVERSYNNTLDKKWLFGRYKANLVAAYGTAGGVISATIFFWVLPWRFVLFAASTIGIILAIIILIKKNKQDKTNSKNDTKIETLEHELEDLKNKYKDIK